jgi:hypothetical protein
MQNTSVKRLTLVTAFVVFGAMFAIAQQVELQTTPALNMERSLTGTVTCAARIVHQYTCQRNQTLQTCTLACVERGSEFVLMVGDQPYILEGDRHNLDNYAGGKATVTGTVTGARIQVRTVSDANGKVSNSHIGG